MRHKLSTILLVLLSLFSCKHDAPSPVPSTQQQTEGSQYPEAIEKIILTKCAVSGCHNAASYENAGGLLLNSWEHLFDGGNNGAVVIPYDTANSSLLYFINTDPALGPVATPTMPLDNTPLSKEEYLAIKNWITSGAPDKNGNIPFASNPETRQKIYITHQGCDLIGVIDAEKKVIMRYIKAGKDFSTEIADHIQVSKDGRYAYVSFWNGSFIQKIDARTDSIVASAQLQASYWKTLHLSDDGQKLIATSWQTQAAVVINTATMQVIQTFNSLSYPESITMNAAGDVYYITARFGNTVYKLTPGGNVQKISIDGNPPVTTGTDNTPNPYRILMSDDYSKYFVSCENTNEVKVMDAQTDQLLKTIPVGRMPQAMALSSSTPYLFVTCLNDTLKNGFVGSVYAINYNTHETTKIEGRFFQPHGIAVDDKHSVFYVFSRNQDKAGPQPHHVSSCNGRNGYYNIFNLATLQSFNNRRYEISVDPYAADTRFK